MRGKRIFPISERCCQRNRPAGIRHLARSAGAIRQGVSPGIGQFGDGAQAVEVGGREFGCLGRQHLTAIERVLGGYTLSICVAGHLQAVAQPIVDHLDLVLPSSSVGLHLYQRTGGVVYTTKRAIKFPNSKEVDTKLLFQWLGQIVKGISKHGLFDTSNTR